MEKTVLNRVKLNNFWTCLILCNLNGKVFSRSELGLSFAVSQGVSSYAAGSPPAADEFSPWQPKNLIRNFVKHRTVQFCDLFIRNWRTRDWIRTFFSGFTISQCSCAERLFSIEFQNGVSTHHAFTVQNFRRSWCSNCRPHWLKIRSRFWRSKFWTARRLNFKILIHWAWFCVTSSDILSNSSGSFLEIQRLQLAGSSSTVFAANLIFYFW